MVQAKISDIFMSYQGEGPYVGIKQLFIRFYGCFVNCAYCDTKPTSYKTFTKEELLNEIEGFKEPYHSISLTGGEPLEQIDFLKEFLILVEGTHRVVYLETNGILHDEFRKIVDYIDIISMDIKLPSSTGKGVFWKEHIFFLEIAKSKNVFVKVIVTDKTDIEDLFKTRDIVKSIDKKIPFVLQPVDPLGDIKEPSQDKLSLFKHELDKSIANVKIVPQYHKILDLK